MGTSIWPSSSAASTQYADRPLKIGSFSAASNVTGIVSDTRAISALLHRHGALSFWDFAAAAPYVDVQMSPHRGGDALDYKDAIFLSPHKLIGGPGTPGVLLIRRELMRNRVPAVVGGGTVAYVNPEEHVYLADLEHREEGGTPAILESIRCGLVFQLKQQVGVPAIREREESFIRRAIERWEAHPNIEILGNRRAERLSIVSFVIRHGPQYLHHNFVVAVLNDMFGIQSRGGCSCAGPYGHRLLGIDIETSHEFERAIGRGCEGIKPGWVRVNFNYFIGEEVFDFILQAVEIVASDGWKLLPQYRFSADTGPLAPRRRARRGALEPARHQLRRRAHGICRPPPPRALGPPGRLSGRSARDARPAAQRWRCRPSTRRWTRTSRHCAGSLPATCHSGSISFPDYKSMGGRGAVA